MIAKPTLVVASPGGTLLYYLRPIDSSMEGRRLMPTIIGGSPVVVFLWTLLSKSPNPVMNFDFSWSEDLARVRRDSIHDAVFAFIDHVLLSGRGRDRAAYVAIIHQRTRGFDVHLLICANCLRTDKQMGLFPAKADKFTAKIWCRKTNLKQGWSDSQDRGAGRLSDWPKKYRLRGKERGLFRKLETWSREAVTKFDSREQLVELISSLCDRVQVCDDMIVASAGRVTVALKGGKYGKKFGFASEVTEIKKSRRMSSEEVAEELTHLEARLPRYLDRRFDRSVRAELADSRAQVPASHSLAMNLRYLPTLFREIGALLRGKRRKFMRPIPPAPTTPKVEQLKALCAEYRELSGNYYRKAPPVRVGRPSSPKVQKSLGAESRRPSFDRVIFPTVWKKRALRRVVIKCNIPHETREQRQWIRQTTQWLSEFLRRTGKAYGRARAATRIVEQRVRDSLGARAGVAQTRAKNGKAIEQHLRSIGGILSQLKGELRRSLARKKSLLPPSGPALARPRSKVAPTSSHPKRAILR